MTTMTKGTESLSKHPRNETDVDRELEDIARMLLDNTATDNDRVQYQRLLSWRRNNMLNLPSLRKHLSLKG